ncbi:MAG: hypothetical protein ACJAZF_000023 [Granulosicoccus sp.]|jgi:uncharacterized protein (TIGR02099 family)
MIIRTAKLTARVCLTLIGILLILLALLSAGVRLGLPLVANYKPNIESRLSDYLRSPVAIGDLKLSWEGFGPLLKAEKVAVFESSDRKVTLDELLIDLNLAKSVFRGVPVINELTLVGASFSIEADEAGQYRLHGMDRVRSARTFNAKAENQKGNGLDLMAWLLTARKVGLLDTKLTLIDKQADLRLVIQDLNIRAENDGDFHQLRIDVLLPEELGGSLTAGVDLIGTVDALDEASGDIYINADALQVNALAELLRVGGLAEKLQQVGSPIDTAVSLELWGRWEDGHLLSARGPVTTSAITNSTTGELLGESISANLELSVTDRSASIVAKDTIISMGTDTWRVDKISGNWKHEQAEKRSYRHWNISASGAELDVSSSSRFIEGVLEGFQPEIASNLGLARPLGKVLNWTFGYRSDGTTPMVSVQADLQKIQFRSTGKMLGLGPISGRVSIIDSKGEVALSADSMPIDWLAMTHRELNLDSVKAVLSVDVSDFKRVMIEGDIELEDDGVDLSTRLNLTAVSGQSPHLDMQSRFAATDINALKQWLPQNKGFSRWFERAIESGSVSDGSLLVFGSLSEFPFDSGEGVFRVSANVNDARVAFHPKWPAAFNINGSLELNGPTLTGVAQNGSMDKFDLTQMRIQIVNLKKPVLKLTGTGAGNLQEVIDFGVNGPLKPVLEAAISDVKGSGQVDMDIEMTLPLYRKQIAGSDSSESVTSAKSPPEFAIDGSLFLNGNAVEFQRANLPLQNVQGSIGFDRSGIRVNKLKAEFLSQPVRISATTEGRSRSATTTISVTGALEGNDVLVYYKNPLDQFLRGASNWAIELAVPHSAKRLADDGVQLHMQSDLVGTELRLPKPLYKSSGKTGDFQLHTAFKTGQRDQRWDIQLEGKLHAGVITNSQGLQSLVANFGAANLLESSMVNPAPGLRLQGKVDRLAADDWVDSIAQFINSLENGDPTAPQPIIPISAQLDIGSLELGARSLGTATLSMASNKNYLTTTIKNASFEGQVAYPRNYWSKKLPLNAHIEHIDMAVIDALNTRAAKSEGRKSAPLDPRILPPIDAKIVRFTRKAQTIKDLVLRSQPNISGLQVTTLGFAYENMQLVGQGYWRLKDPQGVNPSFKDQHQTQLKMVLQSDDFGKGFADIGLDDVISQGQGTAQLQISWPGPAYLPSLADLDGRIKLNIEQGNIIPVEPGAGRIVGLFALQALPRRLNLDFTDISNDGLAFKRMTGDALIDKGVVDVSLVQLTGPIGVVDVVGKSDLNTRQFDQTITVLPRVSAALPIIGVISGGASAGVGALIATGVLKALGIDLDRIGLREYSLTGTWDKPVFKSRKTLGRRDR